VKTMTVIREAARRLRKRNNQGMRRVYTTLWW